MKIKIKSFLIIFLTALTLLFKVDTARAQTVNTQCLGIALAEYMNELFETINSQCGGLNNIRLLSPAFNMTNNVEFGMIQTASSQGIDWSVLYGIAGNSYDYDGPNGVLDHVSRFMTGSGLPNLPIFLTETGVFRSGDPTRFREHLTDIKDGTAAGYSFLGADFFAPFAGLGGGEWADDFNLDNSMILTYCGGECTNMIGFNSATYFGSVDNRYYEDARELLGMGTTTSITNPDPAEIQHITRALDQGFTPVVRIGDATRRNIDGLEADTYGSFLCALDASVGGRTVYAIAGPNEPQSEYWFAPECAPQITDFGDDRRPLEFGEGFWLGKYPCDATANPEFHPLRPYPASPCDMLIPRSVPEAPVSEEPGSWMKYLSYACGTNLTYSTFGTFDPYGRGNDTYVYSDLDRNQDNPFLLQVCDRSQWSDIDGGPVTCYMTLKFRIAMDFSDAKVGILGNTQLTNLSPVLKVNNYLAYYWGGIPGMGDKRDLDPNNPLDIDLVVNYSGPIQKLLPETAKDGLKETIRSSRQEEVHNYLVEDTSLGPDDGVTGNERLGQLFIFDDWYNVPFASMEDMAGEVFFTGSSAGGAVGVDPVSGLTTAPYQFNITCAVGAHENCPF